MLKKNNIILPLLALFLSLTFVGPAMTQAGGGSDKAKVGKVSVTLKGPAGLNRVDGLSPEADAYIKKLEPKFKLQVLAIYADKSEWIKFSQTVKSGKAASIPRLAIICVPRKMANKSYNLKALRKEFKKYDNWFGLAANNRPMAAILTGQANSKLKEYMGVDLDFKYKTGPHTRKVSETSNSISLASRVSFNVNGRVSDGILAATSLAIGDKLIFTGYFDEASTSEKRDEVIAKSIEWRGELSAAQ